MDEEHSCRFRKFRLFIPVGTLFTILVISLIVYPYFTFTYSYEKSQCLVENISRVKNRTIFTVTSTQNFKNCQKSHFNITSPIRSGDNEHYLLGQTYRCYLKLDLECPHFFWHQYRISTTYKIIAGLIIGLDGLAVIVLFPIVIDMGRSFVYYLTCSDLHYRAIAQTV